MKRDNCVVCNAAEPVQIEYREGAPVFLNRLASTVEQARATPCGVLDIVGCSNCGFVWNRSFDPKIVSYDSEYENDQTHSAAFRTHVERMAAKVLDAVSGDESVEIIEVGCGQGVFLIALAASAGSRLRRAVGFDPAFRSTNSIVDERIKVYQEYFDEKTVELLDAPPSLFVTRHTIEHIADPVAFFKAIRQGIGDTPARLFVETPDVSWILANLEIEDLFYEHCSLFTPASMALALRAAGFAPVKIELVFNNQYLWAEATVNETDNGAETFLPNLSSFPNMSVQRRAFVATWQTRIAESESVVVWGAGAKGVTFCTLVDPDATRITAVVDINPGKQKKHLPLSCHRVVGPNSLSSLLPSTVIVMNPNYREEIATLLSELNIDAELLVLGGEVVKGSR